MAIGVVGGNMSESSTGDRWEEDRTTFQRVYDVVLGTDEYVSAPSIADRARCSESAARAGLDQLAEMGIAERREGRPTAYRRNEAYLTWRRVESLARDHSPETLRERLDGLVEEDREFQEQYGVPDPGAVAIDDVAIDDHETVERRWADLSEWRTVRRDIRVLRRAVRRAESPVDESASA